MGIAGIQKIKQIASVIVGLLMGWASYEFSNRGFQFVVVDETLVWIGRIMAAGIVVMELVFNGQLAYKQSNITIFALGTCAYAYGIFSNILGVWSAQGISIAHISSLDLPSVFGILLGLFLEIAPEPLVIYGLIGISNVEGDMLGALGKTLGRGVSGASIPSWVTNQRNEPKIPDKYQPQHKPQFTHQSNPGASFSSNNIGSFKGRNDPPTKLQRTMRDADE